MMLRTMYQRESESPRTSASMCFRPRTIRAFTMTRRFFISSRPSRSPRGRTSEAGAPAPGGPAAGGARRPGGLLEPGRVGAGVLEQDLDADIDGSLKEQG